MSNHVECSIEDKIKSYNTPYKEARKKPDRQNLYLNSAIYQREDIVRACKALPIPLAGEKAVFRVPGMALSSTLRYWQVVG